MSAELPGRSVGVRRWGPYLDKGNERGAMRLDGKIARFGLTARGNEDFSVD